MDRKIENRFLGERIDISYEQVKEFFGKRVSEKKKNDLNYVLYLDNTPEVAIERDRVEKEKLKSVVDIASGTRVLDVGCGIARWGEFFLKKGAYYVGVDATEGMINIAERGLSCYQTKKLIVGDIQRLNSLLNANNEGQKFDIVFVNGVFMYLNDDDCLEVMKQISSCVNFNGKVIINESMAEEERLTLNNFYSEDLSQSYSAIYRTVSEYRACMDLAFSDKFVLEEFFVWNFEDGIQKKRKNVTLEHMAIWKNECHSV